MAAALLHPRQDLPNLLGRLAIDVVQDQLRIAENRIEGSPQLVAHVGQELGLVLAGDLELAPFLLDLAEQPRVLHRDGRLRGKGLQ